MGILLSMGVSLGAYAQDDDDIYGEGVTPAQTTVKKAPVAKKPQYPMMDISGIVVDAATKEPLAGIQVQALNDANYAAMTNGQGKFTISVPTFATSLFVHATRYLSQQVPIVKGQEVKVILISDKFNAMYDDGTNIVAARTAKMQNTTSQTIESDIEDHLGADVRTITRSGGPGYGAAMFIRGLNSLNSNAQPLFVIDGIVRDMQPTRSGLHDGDYGNLLLNLNPEDIDNVTVLKNATAIYGAKGANGVVLINTKRGRSMATRIDANIGITATLVPRLPEMMSASQYRTYASEMLGTYPDINNFTGTFHFLDDDPSSYYYARFHNDTDWTKEVYRSALSQNYNINVQGGDEVGMYNLSVGYTDGQSTAKKNGFNRLNVRFNTDIKVVGDLSTRFDMAFTKINRNVFDNGAPESFSAAPVSSPTFLALIKSPMLNPYVYSHTSNSFSGTLYGPDDFLAGLNNDLTLGNPTALLENGEAINKNRVENTEFYAVIAPKYQFNKYLSATETFNYTMERNSQRYYRPATGMPTFLIPGIGTVQNMAMSLSAKETDVFSDTRVQYTRQFGPHYLDVFGGFRFTSFSFDQNDIEGQYRTGANDKMPNVSASMDFRTATGVDDTWKSITWYANADYNYRNRYFLEASLAMESSSRFGEKSSGLSLGGVKWGIFPSIQAGWLATNEAWFPKNIGLNYLLVKAGYDISGNDDINNYAAHTSFSVSKFLTNNNGTGDVRSAVAAQLDNIGNDEITFEKTSKFNVGFQSYWLNNRLGLDFDFYYHRTTNLLTLKNFDNPVAGIKNYWSNGGTLINRGVEVTLSGKPVVSKNFNVELGASVAHYTNKIKKLPNNDPLWRDGFHGGVGFTSSIYGTANIATMIGEAAGVFYGYQTNGVYANAAEAAADNLFTTNETGARNYFKAGDVRFVDLDGDGEINEHDKTIIGNPNPDVYGNIFARVNYKAFTLALGFNYSLGNDVYNYARSVLEAGSNFYNQTTSMANRWRFEGQQTDVPRLAYGDPMGNSRFSDRWIEDGSYLRLKTLNLAYKVPVNASWLQGLTIWAEANNLFTLTKYLGSDPEFSVSNAVLYQGIDVGNVALSRSFTLGMRINL